MGAYYKDSHRYDDIIDLPYQGSKKKDRIPEGDRAAQFAPFSALNGYEDVIEETARQTEARMEDTLEREDIELLL